MAGVARSETAAWVPTGPTTRPFRFGEQHHPDPDPALRSGTLVGDRYRVLRLLGEGGMGRVYEAEHTFLGRRVALKLLRRDALRQPENVQRFQGEAMAASTIGHAAIVEVIDFATLPDGQVFMVMEMLQGESLEQWMDRPGDLAQILPRLVEVADGLDAAHRAGVIHRDIKPANIFLARRGDGSVHAKILDFGIAKMTDRPAAGFQTEAGSVLGTPYYLAPERATGQALDPRADLYSLGVILYELLTGNVPFVADSFVEILGKHVRQHALDPRQAAPERPIPDRIARLTMRLLAKDPADRPENAGVLAVELGRIAREDAASLRAVATGPRLSAGEAGTSTRVLVEVAARSTSAGVGPGPMTSFAGGVVPAAPATEPGDSRPDAAETEDADLPDGPRRRGPTAAVFLLIVFGVLGAAAGLAYLELRGPAQAARAPAEPAALESPGIPASSASTIAEPAPGVAGRAEPESPAPGPNSSAPGEPEPGPEAPRPARPRREKPRKAPREPTPADKPTESSTAATGPTIKDDVYEE